MNSAVNEGPEQLIMNRSRGESVAAAVIRTAHGDLLSVPSHPDPLHVGTKGEARPVLPRSLADLLLTSVEPPMPLRDGDVVACECKFRDPSAAPLRVVWFMPSTADALRSLPSGTTATYFEQVASWSSRRGGDGDHNGNTQPAAGLGYIELGTGGMTGGGRPHVTVHTHGRLTVPFSRNGSLSDAIEPQLSGLHASASVLLETCYPGLCDSQHRGRELSTVELAWQFPAAVPGCPCLPTHQAVLRLGGPGSQSDLHCDPCDGGGEVGTCTLYYGGDNTHLAVFEERGGGRGFSVGVGRQGLCCAMFMRADMHLHGSIWEDAAQVRPAIVAPPPSASIPIRIVTYPLKRLETLGLALAEKGEELVSEVEEKSDARIKRRTLMIRRRQQQTAADAPRPAPPLKCTYSGCYSSCRCRGLLP